MAPGQLLFSVLSQAPAVGALVGTRIYPLRIPQGQPRPAITYRLLPSEPQGSALCPIEDLTKVQVSLSSTTYAQLSALADACRSALHRYAEGGVAIELVTEADDYDDRAGCYLRTMDYGLTLPL